MTKQDLYNRNMIVYAEIQENFQTSCLVYPRVVVTDEGKTKGIDSYLFPDRGAIHMGISGMYSNDLQERYDNIFVMKISSTALSDKPAGPNKLYAHFISNKNNGSGAVQIKSLNSVGYMQVVEVSSDIHELENNRTIISASFYTRNVLLKSKKDGCYYGPFELGERANGKVEIKGLDIYDYNIGKFEYISIKDYLMEVDTSDYEYIQLVTNFDGKSPLSLAVETIDFIEPEALINQIVSIIKKSGDGESGFTRDQLKLLRAKLNEVVAEANASSFSDERKEKMLTYVGMLENGPASFKVALISEALKTKKNRDVLLESLKDEKGLNYFIPDLFQDVDTRNQILDYQKKNGIISEANSSNEEALKSENAELKKELERVSKQLEDAEKTAKQEKQRIQGKGNDEIAEVGFYQKKCKEAQEEYEKWQGYVIAAKDTLNNTLKEFKDESKLLSQVLNQSVLSEILQGQGENADYSQKLEVSSFDTSLLSNVQTAKQFIENVYTFMDNANRQISRDEVVNLLVCIANGFITTFAGAPGTGKTSLCNMLANALGLAREDENSRFTQIAVERGWSSHKDYIGYYNPLSHMYEKSNAELFDAFIRMDKEVQNDANYAPYFVLLDEANLSPIEHYWSVFNRNCDLKASGRNISLGGKDVWKLSPNLRFFATINFDHTTEELSPRFLDRSWVIMLNPQDVDIESDEVGFCNAEKVASMDNIVEFFMPKSGDHLSNTIKNKFESIKKVFADNDIMLSPRNIKMVADYCVVAEKYMEQDPTNPFKVLDYAVAQKILPTINGYGARYDSLCESLEKELDKMPLSKRILEIINNNNEESGTYQLF